MYTLRAAPPHETSFLRPARPPSAVHDSLRTAGPAPPQPRPPSSQPKRSPTRLGAKEIAFLQRAETDLDARRRERLLNELKHRGLLRPHAPPVGSAAHGYKEVSLAAGPIVRTHGKQRTGLETRRPYAWGPLGGPF